MQLRIFDFLNYSSGEINDINQCYDVWLSVYKPILEQCQERLLSDYFYRARKCLAIFDNQKVIGFALLNTIDFSFQGIEDLTYLADASTNFRNLFKQEKKKVLTVEWVTVSPDYRGRFTKVQYVDLIMGLCFFYARDNGYTCSLGFSRTDLKADRVVEKFGGIKTELTSRHGIECGVMVVHSDNIWPHPIRRTQDSINQIYDNYLISKQDILIKEGHYVQANGSRNQFDDNVDGKNQLAQA
jgi:hypothetical protein